MISRADTRRMQELPDNALVLMAVVNDNPANLDNEGGGLRARARVAMNEAGVSHTVMGPVLDDFRPPPRRPELERAASTG